MLRKEKDFSLTVNPNGFGGGLSPGAAITAGQFRLGAAAVDANDRFIYNRGTGDLYGQDFHSCPVHSKLLQFFEIAA